MKINANYLQLQESYLFSTIAKSCGLPGCQPRQRGHPPWNRRRHTTAVQCSRYRNAGRLRRYGA